MHRQLWVCVFALVLAACVAPPAPLASGPFAEITVVQAQGGGLDGQRVRWGGELATTTTGKDETCFEVVGRPLDKEARPRLTDETDGRFIACASGFYDPAIYEKGRELTVIGTLQAPTVSKIGEYEYHYPRVAAETVYLWPKRPRVAYVYGPWGDPFWYPYGYPYWGPWPYGPWPYAFWGPPW